MIEAETPENGSVGDSHQGTGSGGDCFKMFKTVAVNRSGIEVKLNRNSKRYWRGMDGTQTILGWHGRDSKRYWRDMDGTQNGIGVIWTGLKRYWRGMDGTQNGIGVIWTGLKTVLA